MTTYRVRIAGAEALAAAVGERGSSGLVEAVKAVRAVRGCGLLEAKLRVQGKISEPLSRAEADRLCAALNRAWRTEAVRADPAFRLACVVSE